MNTSFFQNRSVMNTKKVYYNPFSRLARMKQDKFFLNKKVLKEFLYKTLLSILTLHYRHFNYFYAKGTFSINN